MRCRPRQRHPSAVLAVSLFLQQICIKSMTAAILSSVYKAALISVVAMRMFGNSVHHVTHLFDEGSSLSFLQRILSMLLCVSAIRPHWKALLQLKNALLRNVIRSEPFLNCDLGGARRPLLLALRRLGFDPCYTQLVALEWPPTTDTIDANVLPWPSSSTPVTPTVFGSRAVVIATGYGGIRL